jgi:hypothetical protein
LETNRLYTHEICPSVLPPTASPTRLGYVIRCSSTRACWTEGKTHLLLRLLESHTNDDDKKNQRDEDEQKQKQQQHQNGQEKVERRALIQEPTSDAIEHLRKLYFLENTTVRRMEYGLIDFSLNQGDYQAPNL